MTKRTGQVPKDAAYFSERLTAYVREHHAESFDPESEQLFDYLDSVGFVQLLMFVDSELGIQLNPAALSLESCATVGSMAQLLTEHAD